MIDKLREEHLRFLLEIHADPAKKVDQISDTRKKLFYDLCDYKLAIGVGEFCRVTFPIGVDAIEYAVNQFNAFANENKHG